MNYNFQRPNNWFIIDNCSRTLLKKSWILNKLWFCNNLNIFSFLQYLIVAKNYKLRIYLHSVYHVGFIIILQKLEVKFLCVSWFFYHKTIFCYLPVFFLTICERLLFSRLDGYWIPHSLLLELNTLQYYYQFTLNVYCNSCTLRDIQYILMEIRDKI